MFQNVKVGPQTNSIYYYGKAYDTFSNSLLVKIDSSNAVVWANAYDSAGYNDEFDVDSSETYIYILHFVTTIFPLHKISASDGSVISSKICNNMKASSNKASVKCFGDPATLFISGNDLLNHAKICKTGTSILSSVL